MLPSNSGRLPSPKSSIDCSLLTFRPAARPADAYTLATASCDRQRLDAKQHVMACSHERWAPQSTGCPWASTSNHHRAQEDQINFCGMVVVLGPSLSMHAGLLLLVVDVVVVVVIVMIVLVVVVAVVVPVGVSPHTCRLNLQ